MQAKREELEEDFRAVYDRQFGRVYKLALLLLGNVADTEDAVQMVFAKVWEKQPHFRGLDHENAWFITVTRNQCRDFLRSYYRRNCTSLESVPEPQVSFFCGEDGALWQAIQKLPQKYREVLYLYYYEGYSVRELSKMLHRKESTLQTQLADARKKLRPILEADGWAMDSDSKKGKGG